MSYDLDSLNKAYMSTLRAIFRVDVPSFVEYGDTIENFRINLAAFVQKHDISMGHHTLTTLQNALETAGEGYSVLECERVDGSTFGAVAIDGKFFQCNENYVTSAARLYRCVMFCQLVRAKKRA